ncbi:MAG: BON domain-containing protein [Candidatus Riflebacteria bacterium]|nr:BON domain-containing protein [Candidatus Riflebacteria bacterium]
MRLNAVCSLAFVAAVVAIFVTNVSLRASETDETIKASFENSYVYKTYLKNDSVTAKAKNCVVTLTGTVSEDSHRALAQDTAANLPGVLNVDNQLATIAEVAVENKDKWIGRKVKLTLLFHRHVNSGKTVVEVKDGIVTLKGEASSIAQKELTGEYAKDIEGVKDLKNEMTVAVTPEPGERTADEKMDDSSVTAQVKMALVTHRSTSSLSTRVETRGGEVTVSGIARNEAEKALVTKLVTDIHGVTSVKNQMTVDEVKKK